MGSKALLVLANDSFREKAIDWVKKAPKDSRVWFSGPKRSLPQNDHIWLLCTACSMQKEWHGIKLAASDWKTLFTAALKRELRIVPNLSGDGFVQLGSGTSDMQVQEASELIEFMLSWCAQNGVELPPHPDMEEGAEGKGVERGASPQTEGERYGQVATPPETAPVDRQPETPKTGTGQEGQVGSPTPTDALGWAVEVHKLIDGWRGSPDALKTQWASEWIGLDIYQALKRDKPEMAAQLREAVMAKIQQLRAA